ncbi:hypothetical protein AGMMS49928_25060 [Spirochaetia bacterium]|nr:hypothetical protein AGMMS49928_25060 [Spirochaetia bacterium]
MAKKIDTGTAFVVFGVIFFIFESYACFSNLSQPDGVFELLILVTGISCIISLIIFIFALFKIEYMVLTGIISVLFSTVETILCFLFFDISPIGNVSDESLFILISIIVGLVLIFSLWIMWSMLSEKKGLSLNIFKILPARNIAIVFTILLSILFTIGIMAYNT